MYRVIKIVISACLLIMTGIQACNAQLYKCSFINSVNQNSTTNTFDLTPGGKDLTSFEENPANWHGRFIDLGEYFLSVLKVNSSPSPFPPGTLATQTIKIMKKTGAYTSDTE